MKKFYFLILCLFIINNGICKKKCKNVLEIFNQAQILSNKIFTNIQSEIDNMVNSINNYPIYIEQIFNGSKTEIDEIFDKIKKNYLTYNSSNLKDNLITVEYNISNLLDHIQNTIDFKNKNDLIFEYIQYQIDNIFDIKTEEYKDVFEETKLKFYIIFDTIQIKIKNISDRHFEYETLKIWQKNTNNELKYFKYVFCELFCNKKKSKSQKTKEFEDILCILNKTFDNTNEIGNNILNSKKKKIYDIFSTIMQKLS